MRSRLILTSLTVAAALSVAGPVAEGEVVPAEASATATSAATATTATTAPALAAPATAAGVLAGMTLRQKVGQLFMVGTPSTSVDPRTLGAVRQRYAGSVILMGASRRGVAAPRRVARKLQGASRTPLFVATDQEGGLVQRLQGPGFSAMPSALAQGRWTVGRLQAAATAWGRQVASAGVNLDLAPVADTVPSPGFARVNAPIGALQRSFGFQPARVAAHVGAFARGMSAAGVATCAKHFPGLGRVRDNTDLTAHVVDPTTRADDPYLQPFRAAIGAGVPFMMMSSAYYPRIDPRHPAVFSPTVIALLRQGLGFGGVVVTDSLDTPAVARWSPGRRATWFLRSGGDMVLLSSPAQFPVMYAAVLKLAERSPGFAALVDASALRVLTAKQHQGLL